MGNHNGYEAIVIGASAGGLQALSVLLSVIPGDYSLPVIIVQHRTKEINDLLETLLQRNCSVKVTQAKEKEKIQNGTVYIAPGNYHLLIEQDRSFSLSSDSRVKNSRPSIDVLFETAAEVYQSRLIGIILTGTNDDGAEGIKAIYHYKGLTVAQDPEEAQYKVMPESAIRTGMVTTILPLEEIQQLIVQQSKSTV